MIRAREKIRQVTTEEPWAGKDICFGRGLFTQRIRVKCRDLKRALKGCGRGNEEGIALRRRAHNEFANACSESPPNQMSVFFSKSLQRTISESIIDLQAFETRDARARADTGR